MRSPISPAPRRSPRKWGDEFDGGDRAPVEVDETDERLSLRCGGNHAVLAEDLQRVSRVFVVEKGAQERAIPRGDYACLRCGESSALGAVWVRRESIAYCGAWSVAQRIFRDERRRSKRWYILEQYYALRQLVHRPNFSLG